MFKALKCLALAAPLVAVCATTTAQNFTSPAAPEFIYGDPNVFRPTHNSAYSVANVNTAWGSMDMYLSGWGSDAPGANSELTYQFAIPGNPTALVYQGSILYSDIQDIEVGAVYNNVTGNMNVLVGYYKNGSGHYVDIYDVTGSPVTPLNYSTTLTLSSSPNYGRLSIDCHKLYGVAFAWEYPGIGIQTLVGDGGNWSGVTTLNGTFGQTEPDVAFAHVSPLNVHYVYHDGSGTITESFQDWNVLMSTPGIINPIIEDVNFTGLPLISRPVIDCPDHYDVENWAYTYINDYTTVNVRLVDYHSGTPPTTVGVNSGVLGNVSSVGNYKALTSALHYGNGGIGGSSGQVTVGWYTTDGGGFNGYVALEMREDGTALLSAPDYMALPNAFTPFLYPLRPGIAFSKASDPGLVPDFLYTSFYDLDPAGFYNQHHAFHPWGIPVFRGEGAPDLHPECGSKLHKAIASENKVYAYPNPFRNTVTHTVTLAEEGTLQLVLTDITGRIVWKKETKATKGQQVVSTDDLSKLAPGTYILTASLNSKKIATQKLTKK